jgi:uncharacterized membrane protein YkvI
MADNQSSKKLQGDDFAIIAALGVLVLHIVTAIVIANHHFTLPLMVSGIATVLLVYVVLFLDQFNSPSLKSFQTVRQATDLVALMYALAWAIALLITGLVFLQNLL